MLLFAEQLYAFAMTILAGLTAGILFDMYRLVRRALRPGQALSWFIDLLFWAVAAPVLLALLLLGNWGELRLYVFLGVLAGGILYFGFLSAGVLAALSTACQWCGRGLIGVGRALLAPAMLATELLRRLASALGGGPWASLRRPGRGWRRPWIGLSRPAFSWRFRGRF